MFVYDVPVSENTYVYGWAKGTTIRYGWRNSLELICFNPLKLSGNYMYHLLYQSVIVHSVFVGLLWVSM
jgi:hypothetical protein